MIAEQSQFHKYPKKLLYRISSVLLEKDSGWEDGNPYYNNNFDLKYDDLQEIGKYVGATHINQEDVEFFVKFIEINEDKLESINGGDKSLIESLEIPIAELFRVDYSVYGSCLFRENKYDDFSSYDKSWVSDSVDQLRQDGGWDFYNGMDHEETNYENFETHDFSIDDVYPATQSQKESRLSKLVIENTENIIDSLDRKTLIKLKSIIESRLRIL
jgi:hypothetical protein